MSMSQGVCAFSGYTIPKGSGITKVMLDGKIVLTRSAKERSLVKRKITARSCKWTQSSRVFFKKNDKSIKEQDNFVHITKIVRGFTLVPKSLVAEAPKTEAKPKNTESSKKNEKVNLKSNNNMRR
ncbi:hypothetical protein GINT2_001972 [Glugoides intestinalis]